MANPIDAELRTPRKLPRLMTSEWNFTMLESGQILPQLLAFCDDLNSNKI